MDNNATNIDANHSSVRITPHTSSLKQTFNSNKKVVSSVRKDCQNIETQTDDHILSTITKAKQVKTDGKKKVSSNKIVYHILHPEELRLTEKKNSEPKPPPVKKVEEKVVTSAKPVALKPVSILPAIKPKLIKPKPKELVTKPEKDGVKQKEYKIENKKDEVDMIVTKSVTTRSGRVTKPPKHLKLVKSISNKVNDIIEPPKKQICMSALAEEALSKPISDSYDLQQNISIPNDLKPAELVEKRKKLSTKYQCKTCKRYYLGRVRMKRHLNLNPDHKVPIKFEPNDETWKNLLERTSKVPKHEQSAKFLGELSYLLQKARNVVPISLKPVVDDSESYHIDTMLSSLLGIPEGKYTIDLNALNEEKEDSSHFNVNHDRILFDSENSAQTSLLNLLDTGQVTFDTSEVVNNSEAVMCVDQLVNERLNSLTGVELSEPPVPSPPTNPQNLSLDLSLDMFSYTS